MQHLTGRWASLQRQASDVRDGPATGVLQSKFPGSRVLSIPGKGSLQYSVGIPEDPGGVVVHATYVEADARRQGVATRLHDALAEKFAGHALDPGGLTDDGAHFWHQWVASRGWPEVNGIIWLEDEESFYAEGSRKTAKRNPPNRLYHFTSQMHLPAILQANSLRTTESNIEITGAGPRVVWLTETTDPGGNGLGGPGFKDQVRFTIGSGMLRGYLHWWPEWSREQGIQEFWYDALASSSGGNPENWWVVTAPIPSLAWDTVEVREGSSWVPLEGA